ncbi:hypothetical protein [Siccirubricoccus sp. G192]|uniref:hypothetical protein n=1 Tax=Siccirubricoccus sp. G192 TaxID=2849651 RepID=UPI001C2BA0AC|nr:hypothetical protein [Siccirubricoccus sp. G192]MBV1796455.1 hypothetical protein [Siccirubricoccus sp. G192]
MFTPTGKGAFLGCLTTTGIRAPDGKAWTARTLNPELDELARQGLLTEDLSCVPELLHPVAVDAMASPEGAMLADAARKAFPAQTRSPYQYSYSMQADPDALRRFRLAIYTNDDAEFSTQLDRYNKDFSPARGPHLLERLFLRTPVTTAWLASRGLAIQYAIFSIKLSSLLQSGLPGSDLPELVGHYRAQQGREDFAAFRWALLQYDLLAGHLEDVRRRIDEIEGG